MSKLINSTDPLLHSQHIQRLLTDLTDHLQFDVMLVDAPRFEALLETTREVLKGVTRAFEHFDEGVEKAWGGKTTANRKAKKTTA
jgi:hypothetical protein